MSNENKENNKDIEKQENQKNCWGKNYNIILLLIKIIILIIFIIFSIFVSVFLGLFSGLYLSDHSFIFYNTNIFHHIVLIVILYGINIEILTKLWKSQKNMLLIFKLSMPTIYILIPYIIVLLFFKNLSINT